MTLNDILKSLKGIGLSKPEVEMFPITDEPKIPGYLCFAADETKERFDTEEVLGKGFDTSETKAKLKAVGEFHERLCLHNPEEEKFIFSHYNQDMSLIDPALFFCYSEEQVSGNKGYIERLRKAQYRWWPVTELTSAKDTFIPAQLIFIPNFWRGELPIRRERISTGAALGPAGTAHALINGFMESCERDACISSYLTKREINKIIDLPKDLDEIVSYLQRYQLEPHLFDVTTDLGVPTVLTATIDRSGIGPAVSVGSRSSIRYKDAVKYSILESIQCRRHSRIMRDFEFPEIPDEEEVNSMSARFYYWHPLERISDLEFWLNSPNTVTYRDLKSKDITFKKALESLQSRGYHIFVADITLPIIRNAGFEVLKVVIPELHPLYLDERAKALYSTHYGSIKNDKTLKPHPIT